MGGARAVGLLFGLALAVYAFVAHRTGSLRRGGMLLALLAASGIAALSIDPSVGNILPTLFQLQNRLFAILVFSNLVLFGLFFALLGNLNKTRYELAEVVRMLARTEYRRAHRGSGEGKSAAIVIPAYKEERTIGQMLSQLPTEVLGYRLVPIVVIDGSYDDTEYVVKSLGHRVATHVVNRGQGGALRTGFEIALEGGADIVVTMDADGQHRVEDLPALIGPVARGEADYAMGTRFAGEYEDRGGTRHVGIVLFSLLISLLTGTRIADCTNGFRAIDAEKLSLMELHEERFNAPELIIQAVNNGLRIKEVPINVLRRAEGDSRKPGRLGYPIGFALAMFKAWLR